MCWLNRFQINIVMSAALICKSILSCLPIIKARIRGEWRDLRGTVCNSEFKKQSFLLSFFFQVQAGFIVIRSSCFKFRHYRSRGTHHDDKMSLGPALNQSEGRRDYPVWIKAKTRQISTENKGSDDVTLKQILEANWDFLGRYEEIKKKKCMHIHT